jgi:GT2 family glycosyltransferase
MSATCNRRQLRHIPAILFHEAGQPLAGAQELELTLLNAHLEKIGHPRRALTRSGVRRVAWPLSASETVSIIIPSKDNPELLATCLRSIREITAGVEPEIIVADNGSVRPETKAYLRRLELTGTAAVIPCPGPFNFSRINNDARRHASGSILVFLNDDTRIVSPDWLIELASLAARPEIGAVGALLLYPDGAVQHAGVVLGIRGIADHAFRHESGDAAGYMDLLRCRREVTAVTGACLAVSAVHFDAIGGFDETLAVTANDMDLCLRLRARGLINIWSPWCVVEHAESKSRGVDCTDAALERQGQETLVFTRRWGHLLDCDPTYNPGLSRIAPDYSLRVE